MKRVKMGGTVGTSASGMARCYTSPSLALVYSLSSRYYLPHLLNIYLHVRSFKNYFHFNIMFGGRGMEVSQLTCYPCFPRPASLGRKEEGMCPISVLS